MGDAAGGRTAVAPTQAAPALESAAPGAADAGAPVAGTPRCRPGLFGDAPGPAGAADNGTDYELGDDDSPVAAPAPGTLLVQSFTLYCVVLVVVVAVVCG